MFAVIVSEQCLNRVRKIVRTSRTRSSSNMGIMQKMKTKKIGRYGATGHKKGWAPPHRGKHGCRLCV